MISVSRICALAFGALLVFATAARAADAADPAAQTVSRFNDALESVMKDGPALGVSGRVDRLTPAVERSFDLTTMAKFMVGPSWSSMSADQQGAVAAAFGRMTVASYAVNFARYSGQDFTVDPQVAERGGDKLVQSKMIIPGADPVTFIYRMRQDGGTWKIIDIFLNGFVSELATRRSDFASTVASGGAPALIAKIDGVTEALLSGKKAQKS